MDRRIDFLNLAGGKKVEIPFEMFVVFATNLDPATLVDAAFLRRIQTKVEVATLTDEHFSEIFHAVCKEFNLECEPSIIGDLIDVIRKKCREPLRACHPRDIINQIRWVARYEQTEPVLDRKALMDAVAVYFVSDGHGVN